MPAASGFWTSFCNGVLDWIYPVKCSLCGQLSESCPCEACLTTMAGANPDFLAEKAGDDLEFRACTFAYTGRASQAVRRLKYSRSTALAPFMAATVADRIRELGSSGDLVVPVPMHVARQSWRGFNQAVLLAGGSHGLEVNTRCLKRVRATRPQVGLSLVERQKNLDRAFRATGAVSGRRVLLVDDVVTSGHTARECARVLKASGASSVGVVAFAGNME